MRRPIPTVTIWYNAAGPVKIAPNSGPHDAVGTPTRRGSDLIARLDKSHSGSEIPDRAN
jgi:hypothetical protein